MPHLSQRAQSIRNLTKILQLGIKERACKSRFDTSNDNETSNDHSDMEELQESLMSQDSFFNLVTMIETHPLTVALRQMGMCGNDPSVGVLALFFRILEGSVILYCSQVIGAILSLGKRSHLSTHKITICEKAHKELPCWLFLTNRIGSYTTSPDGLVAAMTREYETNASSTRTNRSSFPLESN
ncbi:uncharacterized protein VP01_1038g10 [Puccinia sorghi]|uniref:Uncharacterized protein n=1 Tax=Puccinia sorghi TaxID=27349 RepID=A0A0L6VUI9_9BASI|nr:uncharacterized protein VP01_1038g10 [Puccinia sorghi]